MKGPKTTSLREAARREAESVELTLLKMTSRILNEIHKRAGIAGKRLTIEKLAEEALLDEARAKAILYFEAQGCTQLPLSEIRLVLKYAKRFAADTKDVDLRRSLKDWSAELRQQITEYLEKDKMEPYRGAERVLADQLGLTWSSQKEFSEAHSGYYILVRFDSDGGLLISKMRIFEGAEGSPVCRFRTARRLLPEGERIVNGYIYRFEDHVYAIGRIDESGAIRCTILNPVRDGSRNMDGLRLGISLDDNAFAHRLYCRYLGKDDPGTRVDPLTNAWDSTDEAIQTIVTVIPDIRDIMKRLKHWSGNPYGMLIPRVR